MMSRNSKKDSYRQARVLVTGGMGFIGSNLVIALVERGALVTVVDAQIAGCGADPRNLQSVREQIRISTDDMQDADRMAELIPEQDVIFNLAGEISHIRSITEPLRDLSINCAGQLQFLNLCRLLNPGATVIYASSRQVYGHPLYLPVDEKHPVNPVTDPGGGPFGLHMDIGGAVRDGPLEDGYIKIRYRPGRRCRRYGDGLFAPIKELFVGPSRHIGLESNFDAKVCAKVYD